MPKLKGQHSKKQPIPRGGSCHGCSLTRNQSEYAKCTVSRCKNYYCFTCIYQKYDKAKDCWICYSCGGNCQCILCVGIDRNRKKRKPKPQGDSLSCKSMDRKDKDDAPSQVQDPSENIEVEGSSKKKRNYSTRRLPGKKNNAFSYKKKRRSGRGAKLPVDQLLKNLKPEDKIFKIKRDAAKKSSSQSQNNSQEQLLGSVSDSESQENPSSISEENSEPEGQRSEIKMNEKDKNSADKNPAQKQSENNSSSLNFLGDKKQETNIFGSRKTKSIRKNTRVSKLPTIKSVKSKKQSGVSKESVKSQSSEHQSDEKNLVSDLSQDILPEDSEPQSQGRRKGRNSRDGRSRTRGKRKTQYKLQTSDYEDSENEADSEEKEKPKRGGNRRRKHDEEEGDKSQSKRQISSRQTKQLRDIINSDVPKRRSQRNVSDIDAQSDKRISNSLKEESADQQQISIRPESSSIKQDENQSEMSGNAQNQESQKSSIRISNNMKNNVNKQAEDESEEEQNDSGTKKVKKNMVKDHYFEQLKKNQQYQADSSECEEDSKGNEEENEKSMNPSEISNRLNQPSNKQSQALNPEKQEESIKQKPSISQEKPNTTKSPEKSLGFSAVYKKSAHHKKAAQSSQVAHQGAQKNAIVNKWKNIQDHELVDIKNIQRLGMMALFARQNLSKEMNELIKRRNLVMQKLKHQAEAEKQAQNVASN